MELVKLDKVERNKIWEAMIEAGVVIEKPKCKKLKTAQYDLHKRLNNTNTIQSIQLMRTILFFYDKSKTFNEQFKDQRKLFHQKLNDKQKVMNQLTEDIKTLKRQNASLESDVKSLKDRLREESKEKEYYKRAKLDNLKSKNEVKPAPENIDCYGMSACVVKGELIDYDE